MPDRHWVMRVNIAMKLVKMDDINRNTAGRLVKHNVKLQHTLGCFTKKSEITKCMFQFNLVKMD